MLTFSHEVPIATERLRKELPKKYSIRWVDLLVLCTLIELEKVNDFIYTTDIIKYLEMNRDWIYASVKRLRAKELIVTERTPAGEANLINISGFGKGLVRRIGRSYRDLLYSDV